MRIADAGRLLEAGSFGNLDNVPSVTIANFFAGDPNTRGGVRVAVRQMGDTQSSITVITGSGDNLSSQVRTYPAASVLSSPGSPSLLQEPIDPFGTVLASGVYVG